MRYTEPKYTKEIIETNDIMEGSDASIVHTKVPVFDEGGNEIGVVNKGTGVVDIDNLLDF
ncbi:MAG: hypothetical protein IJ398_06865 [Clostridia bacterium]|nr:hypothetical protein [Clostridia bacterium]